MTRLHELGLLSDEAIDIGPEVRRRFADIFALADKTNSVLQPQLYTFKPHANDTREIVSVVLLLRALSTFQSVILLLERGAQHEARVVLRSLIEATFTAVAMSKGRDTAKRILTSVFLEQLHLAKQIRRCVERGLLPKDAINGLTEYENDAKKKAADHGTKKLSIQAIAQMAGMESHYETAYRQLCASTHVNLHGLEQYLHTSDDGELLAINTDPHIEGADIVLFTAIESLLRLLNAVLTTFEYESPKELEPLTEQFNRLGKSLSSKTVPDQ